MSNSLLNISGKLDSKTVALYKSVIDATNQLDIPFVVVGASARDIVLHYGHGADIQRATADIDFGIQIPDWSAFEALKESLLERGFTETRSQHRMISPDNIPLDIVPFGQVADNAENIEWPPNGDWVMNILGFQEAYNRSERVCIQNTPRIDIPVATPSGMAILKLIAWTDRASDMRGKDAKDLLYLFSTYEKIPVINDELYENQDLMEKYDWDIELASAYQLGADSRAIMSDKTYDVIAMLFNDEHESLSVDILIEEMCEYIEQQYIRNEQMMNAFIDGFLCFL